MISTIPVRPNLNMRVRPPAPPLVFDATPPTAAAPLAVVPRDVVDGRGRSRSQSCDLFLFFLLLFLRDDVLISETSEIIILGYWVRVVVSLAVSLAQAKIAREC